MRRVLAAMACVALAGCAAGPLAPAALDTRNEQCRNCRMVASDVRTAAQIVAPGELPVFFDDLGCLRAYLEAHPLAADAVVFVADHRTGAWIREADAVITTTDTATPMGSGLIAHAR